MYIERWGPLHDPRVRGPVGNLPCGLCGHSTGEPSRVGISPLVQGKVSPQRDILNLIRLCTCQKPLITKDLLDAVPLGFAGLRLCCFTTEHFAISDPATRSGGE